ncbi:MAG TPA: glycosyltransferase family 4 protein [Methylophilus sp.]|nr:glycosyltransferase family 4 protein [Methylophilus sp.]HQQ33999.1 glycosyltransferase family 4 protein [Methylophilus sp.]
MDINQDNIYYVPDTRGHKFLHHLSRYLPERIGIITAGFLMHLITQFYQWKLAREIIKEKLIDVVHEPAPVSAVQPSAMFLLGAPVVIGPMNGGMDFPVAFRYMSGKSERFLYRGMRLFASLYNLIIPGKFFANILLVANHRTKMALPKFHLGRVLELVENGVFSVADAPRPAEEKPEASILYVGRLVDWKMIEIAIEAVQRCKSKVSLTIVGDGPMRMDLERLCESFAKKNVTFTGAVPHAQVNQFYDQADIFVLPSVRECGGAVVLEAMARGLPVIATDWGGPADYLTEETGFLVRPDSRDYMVSQFADHIDNLASNPELRFQIGSAAIHRIKTHFMWDAKIQKILNIYQQAIVQSNKGKS